MPLADRLRHQVARHGAGDRIGHHQRRAGQEVGLQVRVDAGLEVAVAREHGGADQVVLRDRLVELGRQVAGVADAGGAAVGRDGKAELLEVGQQAGLLQVLGDDARAGRERGLDVRLHGQAGLDRLLRQQAGGQQHAGVGGVGARGDGGDQHVAVAERQAVAGVLGRALGRGQGRVVVDHLDHVARCGRWQRGRGQRVGFARSCAAVHMRDRMAQAQLRGRLVEAVVGDRRAEQLGELLRQVRDLDAVLRALRAGQRGHHASPRSSLTTWRVVDVAGLGHAEHLLRLEVGLEGLDLVLACGRCPEVLDGLARRPGRSPSWRRTRAPCWRWSRGRAAAACAVPSPKNSTNLPTTLSLRSISVTVSTRSVAVTPSRSLPLSCTPTTSGVRK